MLRSGRIPTDPPAQPASGATGIACRAGPGAPGAVEAKRTPVRGGTRGHFGDYRRMECILFRAVFM